MNSKLVKILSGLSLALGLSSFTPAAIKQAEIWKQKREDFLLYNSEEKIENGFAERMEKIAFEPKQIKKGSGEWEYIIKKTKGKTRFVAGYIDSNNQRAICNSILDKIERKEDEFGRVSLNRKMIKGEGEVYNGYFSADNLKPGKYILNVKYREPEKSLQRSVFLFDIEKNQEVIKKFYFQEGELLLKASKYRWDDVLDIQVQRKTSLEWKLLKIRKEDLDYLNIPPYSNKKDVWKTFFTKHILEGQKTAFLSLDPAQYRLKITYKNKGRILERKNVLVNVEDNKRTIKQLNFKKPPIGHLKLSLRDYDGKADCVVVLYRRGDVEDKKILEKRVKGTLDLGLYKKGRYGCYVKYLELYGNDKKKIPSRCQVKDIWFDVKEGTNTFKNFYFKKGNLHVKVDMPMQKDYYAKVSLQSYLLDIGEVSSILLASRTIKKGQEIRWGISPTINASSESGYRVEVDYFKGTKSSKDKKVGETAFTLEVKDGQTYKAHFKANPNIGLVRIR